MMAIEDLTPRDFLQRQAAGSELLMLDVREAAERELASIPGCLWIPMAEVPGRLDEIDPHRTVVVLCRSGSRSLQVANFLNQKGFPKVANLTGGILRWSVEVDPSVPTY